MTDFDHALAQVPEHLRSELCKAFGQIIQNYQEHRWEPAELNGGKLCEAVYTILNGQIIGSYPNKPQKPANFLKACQGLEQAEKKKFARSVRVQIPRLLVALYEVRNNRNVGHIGADVDPNHMDAELVLHIAKWIMAELVRIFHNVDTDIASRIVETLSSRTVPLIWEQGSKKRVLNPSLDFRDKTLAVLYTSNQPETVRVVVDWVEYSNVSVFRKSILKKLHTAKLIEFDRARDTVELLPPGVKYVEDNIL